MPGVDVRVDEERNRFPVGAHNGAVPLAMKASRYPALEIVGRLGKCTRVDLIILSLIGGVTRRADADCHEATVGQFRNDCLYSVTKWPVHVAEPLEISESTHPACELVMEEGRSGE